MKNGINHWTETHNVSPSYSLSLTRLYTGYLVTLRSGVKTKQLKCDFQMTTNYFSSAISIIYAISCACKQPEPGCLLKPF